MTLNAGAIATEKRMCIRRWDQAELARECGTSRATICRLLAGKRLPGRDLATRLMELLGVDVHLWRKVVEGHTPTMTERKHATRGPRVQPATRVHAAHSRRRDAS